MKHITVKTVFMVVSLSLPTAFNVNALPFEQGKGMHHKEQCGHKGMPKLAKMAKMLNLDSEQKEQIKAIYRQAKSDKQQNRSENRGYRQKLKALIHSNSFNEQAFLTLYNSNYQHMADAALQRAKVKNAIYNILTSEQQEKFKKLKAKRKGKRNRNDGVSE
ncbi:Spy/CpxP family protein refolding chaperone [Thalassotalea sediminis]|uniref:Spy/CpxP family protein refolding chaperone n=1 Tax=Thalassotalea sediminis TaxID=1759089 RepID=UPI0025728CD9|nr:Spy/CpxP family protein refolding chaperone [Thalassotalea sediminis]